MKTNKTIQLIFYSVALLITFFLFTNITNHFEISAKSITAIEAIEIGLNDAKKYINEPLLIDINSTDSDNISDKNSGIDGKRRAWYVLLGDKEGTKLVNFFIVDRKIVEVSVDDASNYEETINFSPGKYLLSDILIDSNSAVISAKEKKGLRPGDPDQPNDWLIGYHFAIRTVFNQDLTEEIFVIVVFGISPNGNLASVMIEQKTGAILEAREQVGHNDTGNSLWSPF